MWTVIEWNREANKWFSMTGYTRENRATEIAFDLVKVFTPDVIISLSDKSGKIVWAAIGKHPAIGYCGKVDCWCSKHAEDHDHTLIPGSSNA